MLFDQTLKPVSEAEAMEMLGVLPPIYWERLNGYYEIFQVGEPFDADEAGRLRYDTFVCMKEDCPPEFRDERLEVNQWYYVGSRPLLNKL